MVAIRSIQRGPAGEPGLPVDCGSDFHCCGWAGSFGYFDHTAERVLR
jgi:hypothetical protein